MSQVIIGLGRDKRLWGCQIQIRYPKLASFKTSFGLATRTSNQQYMSSFDI